MKPSEQFTLGRKARILGEVVGEWGAKKLPYVLLIVGGLAIGYSVKNMEDEADRARAHQNLTEVQTHMAAACDARIVQNDKLMADRMSERDSLLKDQTDRIAELQQLVQTITHQQQTITHQQRTTVQLSRKQLTEIRQLNSKTPNATRSVINEQVRKNK